MSKTGKEGGLTLGEEEKYLRGNLMHKGIGNSMVSLGNFKEFSLPGIEQERNRVVRDEEGKVSRCCAPR